MEDHLHLLKVCHFHFVLCKVPLYCRAGPGLLEVHSGTEASGCQQMLLPNLSVPLRISGAFTDVQSQAQPADDVWSLGPRFTSPCRARPVRMSLARFLFVLATWRSPWMTELYLHIYRQQ